VREARTRAAWKVGVGVSVAAALALSAGALSAVAQDSRRFASSSTTVASIISALYGAHEDNFRPMGTTSISFQLQLEGPIDASFRPESRLQPRGWLYEIAAYRVSELLELDDVPPSVATIVDRARLRRRVDPAWEGDPDDLMAELVWTSNGVRGAASYWVPNLQRTSDLDSPAGVLRWSAWLEPGAEIPEESTELARDLSNMALFDFLIANVDRMSGGNLRTVTNEGVRRVVIRDHNLAFVSRPSDSQSERLLGELRRTQSFSRRTYARLVALNEVALRAAIADEIAGTLLDEAQIRAVLDRREALLSYIGALVEAHGESAVFVFR
jgi:hypothetical protein